MAGGKEIDITSVFSDTIKAVTKMAETPDKKTAAKKTSTAKMSTAAKKGTTGKKTTAKSTSSKTTTAKKTTTGKSSTSKKTTTTTKKTTTSKAGKIMLEISGRQIDFKTIEKKAAKLGGDCYVVVNEKKIYNKDGKSVNLFS